MHGNRSLFWLSFIVAAIAALFGWSAAENANDLRICELSVGAINSPNAKINIQRVSTAAFSRVIRIDYDVILPSRSQAIGRFAICRFSQERPQQFRTELSSLTTEFGNISDSNLFMLKRFYLETGEARSAQPPLSRRYEATGLAGFSSHVIEWLLSVAARAAPLMLLAAAFMALFKLFRSLPSSRFYGIAGATAATIGAMATTGNSSHVAAVLAITAGIANGIGSLVLYAESTKTRTEDPNASLIVPWVLFGALVAMALFWFPHHGSLGPQWLPETLFASRRLFSIAGYNINATPLSLALILIAAALAFLRMPEKAVQPYRPLQLQRAPSPIPAGFVGFILLMALTGIFNALGYLQSGLEVNPLLATTKALLITMIALSARGAARRPQIWLISLAVVSLEYALAPLLSGTKVNIAIYTLLFLTLAITRRGQQESGMATI